LKFYEQMKLCPNFGNRRDRKKVNHFLKLYISKDLQTEEQLIKYKGSF